MRTRILSILLSIITMDAFAQKVLDADTFKPIVGAKISQVDNNQIVATTDTSGAIVYTAKVQSNAKCNILKPSYKTYIYVYESNASKAIIYMNSDVVSLESVIIKATRENPNPTNTQYSVSEIKNYNTGRDIPMILSQTPNAVATSDAGNGIGYTGLRIRGADPTRTNITLNGVPLNDAESQTVFFVNMPDFASSLQSIQIQRGLGSSTNGAGAFGSTINMQTNEAQENASTSLNIGAGYIIPESKQYQQYPGNRTSALSNVMINTGNTNNGYITARLSYIKSDGYVLRSQSDLQSYYLSAVKKINKTLFKLIHFAGKEKTGQAWNGIPEEILYSTKGFAYNPNRIYNEFTYPNQTDNYMQSHSQLHLNHEFNKRNVFNIALHYTRGKGYYEEYKKDRSLADYQIVVDSSLHITTTDLIRRRWLDNHFLGMVFSHIYTNSKFQFITGGGANTYIGKHLGEVIWARYSGNTEINHPYYNGNSNKTDINIYEKIDYQLNNKVKIWGDFQCRNIIYKTSGVNDNSGVLLPYNANKNYLFFNPKAGAEYKTNKRGIYYIYLGLGNREPVRDDLINATKKSEPKPERLYNLELSHAIKLNKLLLQTNIYGMYYTNQLINDGSVNDVGAYNRINVPKSYRAGIEFSSIYTFSKKLDWTLSVAVSRNKIINFNEYIDSYDSNYNYVGNGIYKTYKNVDLAFSPNAVGSSIFKYTINKNARLIYITKYIASQYLDNTQSDERKLKSYFLNDLQFIYSFQTNNFGKINLNLLCNNIFNTKYENNGYTYGWMFGAQRVNNNFYYPSAGTNFLLKVTLDF